MKKKRILIFTGGGLSPALNSLLYGVIKSAQEKNLEIMGGLFGWACLLNNNKIIDLTDFQAETIKNIGGTFLRSSRTNPFKVADGIKQIKTNLVKNKIDAIVAIGGDDTLGTAYLLGKEEGIPIIGVPKTIDNDLSETYWTPGFPSAASYLADYTWRIKNHAAYALSRIFIIESPGYKSGWLAAAGGLGGADVTLPPEKIINCQNVLEKIQKSYEKNGNYATVIISQYAKFDEPIAGIDDNQNDQYNADRKTFIGLSFTEYLKKKLKKDVRSLHPANYLEAVDPTELDRDFSEKMGREAIELLAREKYNSAVCLNRPDWTKKEIEVCRRPLENMVGRGKYRFLDEEMFDFENFIAKEKLKQYLDPIFGIERSTDEYDRLQKRIAKT